MLVSPDHPIESVGKKWISKFKKRHPEVASVWTKPMERARIDGTTPELLGKWFTELKALMDKNRYLPENTFNMDETGYSIGTSQSSRVLIVLERDHEGELVGAGRKVAKKVPGRQEWVTAIECVSSAGMLLPPMMIFKGLERFKEEWRPVGMGTEDWQWYTSPKGWTNDYLGYQWLTTLFQPSTIPLDPSQRRLLILDGHGSHIRADFLAYCMRHAMNVMVLPPHSSHLTQPLDVGIFRPLKQAMASTTNRVARFDDGRMSRATWIVNIVQVRSKALTESNIRSGWRNAGLRPFRPSLLLKPHGEAPPTTPESSQPRKTPLQSLSAENRNFIRTHRPPIDRETKRRLLSASSSLESVQAKLAVAEEGESGAQGASQASEAQAGRDHSRKHGPAPFHG